MMICINHHRCVQGEDSGQVMLWAYLAHGVRSSIVTSTLQGKLSSNDKRVPW